MVNLLCVNSFEYQHHHPHHQQQFNNNTIISIIIITNIMPLLSVIDNGLLVCFRATQSSSFCMLSRSIVSANSKTNELTVGTCGKDRERERRERERDGGKVSEVFFACVFTSGLTLTQYSLRWIWCTDCGHVQHKVHLGASVTSIHRDCGYCWCCRLLLMLPIHWKQGVCSLPRVVCNDCGGQLESRGKVSCCLGPREFQAAGAHRTAKGSSSGGTLTTSNLPWQEQLRVFKLKSSKAMAEIDEDLE